MPTRILPPRPSLHQLKIQATELQRAHRDRDPSAAARIAAHHPEMKGWPPRAVLDKPLALADAQLVIAREYGFGNWSDLKRRVEQARQIERIKPHPGFDAALAATARSSPPPSTPRAIPTAAPRTSPPSTARAAPPRSPSA